VDVSTLPTLLATPTDVHVYSLPLTHTHTHTHTHTSTSGDLKMMIMSTLSRAAWYKKSLAVENLALFKEEKASLGI